MIDTLYFNFDSDHKQTHGGLQLHFIAEIGNKAPYALLFISSTFNEGLTTFAQN